MATTVIRISSMRHEQLRILAAKRNVTISSLIEDMVDKAIASGEIEDVTPGVELIPQPEGIILRIREVGATLTRDEALSVANGLDRTNSRHMIVLEGGSMVETAKIGRSAALKLLAGGQVDTVSLSLSVASNLARQIRSAAAA